MLVIITFCTVSRAHPPTGPRFVDLGHPVCTEYSLLHWGLMKQDTWHASIYSLQATGSL